METQAKLRKLSDDALDLIFRKARTLNRWKLDVVEDSTLEKLWDLSKMGPTSANTLPMRLVFVKSPDAKELLKPCLDDGNVDKTMQAPVTAIIAQDMHFYEKLPQTFPHAPDAIQWFQGNEALIEETAMRNASLQGAYLIVAARALGLDCGPMSGFNKEEVDKVFFTNTTFRSNFLCNLGYGEWSDIHPRSPRLAFSEVCSIH